MILVPNHCWERVQKHQITLRIQYRDRRRRFGIFIAGRAKKKCKRAQKHHILGGFLVQVLYYVSVLKKCTPLYEETHNMSPGGIINTASG